MKDMKKVLLIGLFSLFLPAAATADGGLFVPIGEYPGVPNGQTITDGATFGMAGQGNRSYLCGVGIGGSAASLSTTIISPSGATITGTRTSSPTAAKRYVNSLSGYDASDTDLIDNVVFFTTPSGANESGKYTLTIGVSNGPGSYFSAGCRETSILCEFNTFVNDANFLEVTNMSTFPMNARMRLEAFSGQEFAPTGVLTVQPAARTDYDLHSIVGANNYGFLLIHPIDFDVIIDGIPAPKVSTYRNGTLTSSVSCEKNVQNSQ